MVSVTAHDHLAVIANAGQKHLHLYLCGVLIFIKYHERIAERTPPHVRERNGQDLLVFHEILDKLAAQAPVELVEESLHALIEIRLLFACQETYFARHRL